jgi:hypothetical protein
MEQKESTKCERVSVFSNTTRHRRFDNISQKECGFKEAKRRNATRKVVFFGNANSTDDTY